MEKTSGSEKIRRMLLGVFLTITTAALMGCGMAEKDMAKENAGASEGKNTVWETDSAEEQTKGDDEGKSPLPAATDKAEDAVITEVPADILDPEPDLPGTGKKIAIDPGHQAKGNSEKEPIGPGSSVRKAKVSSGTAGKKSGVPEYKLNLKVSLLLKEELESRGYEVFMIRETDDVDISNAERARMAVESGADILVRIHANGSENSSVAGALTMAPSKANPYMKKDTITECQRLSKQIIDAFCEATKAADQGVYQTDEMSGLNWCTIPATIVEMGYMTNPEEDLKMQEETYQKKMAAGIANGIDRYFEL